MLNERSDWNTFNQHELAHGAQLELHTLDAPAVIDWVQKCEEWAKQDEIDDASGEYYRPTRCPELRKVINHMDKDNEEENKKHCHPNVSPELLALLNP